jgi:(p)ppGpp synthase/HD superfamily hydrolase
MITFKETKALKDYDSVSLAEILRAHFIETYPVEYTSKLGDAIQVASYLHREDVRRGARGKTVTPPYIEHPLRVAIRMAKYFHVTDPNVLLAGILHDTVEDHSWDFADFEGVVRSEMTEETKARFRALNFISRHFGHVTANVVDQVSNPIFVGERTKAEKIASYQDHVSRAVNYSPSALIVKVSDFVDNAGSLHHHYEYSDPKVQYFVDRYEALVPLYRNAVNDYTGDLFDTRSVLSRIDKVSDQFNLFRQA